MSAAVYVFYNPALLLFDFIALVFGIVIIVDMARRPSWLWHQAGSNQGLWLALEIVALLLLTVLSVIVGILYLALARPRLRAAERAITGSNPWQRYPSDPQPQPSATPATTPAERWAPPGAPTFGWYPDPSTRHQMRYWDGTRWTEHVSDDGLQSSDTT